MYKLDDNSKKRLVNQLIEARRELTWSAQKRGESSDEYGARVDELLFQYKNKGNLAKAEVFEISDSNEDRERLATYSFLQGIRGEVKKYMCDISVYKNLSHARKHAHQISRRLDDLKQIKKAMMTLV